MHRHTATHMCERGTVTRSPVHALPHCYTLYKPALCDTPSRADILQSALCFWLVLHRYCTVAPVFVLIYVLYCAFISVQSGDVCARHAGNGMVCCCVLYCASTCVQSGDILDGAFVSWVPWCYFFYTPALSALARYLYHTASMEPPTNNPQQ